MARFQRIARDLERLPCELHDGVLADLGFAQLIRLSVCAGPRVIWSLENNLAPWGPLFREGEQIRTLLKLTDLVKAFCFQNPKEKDAMSWDSNSFQYAAKQGRLSFLSFQGSDWKTHGQSEQFRVHQIVDAGRLSRYWLEELNEIVLDTTWQALHEDYPRLIEPWQGEIPGTQAIFVKVPYVGKTKYTYKGDQYTAQAKRSAFSIEELAQFIGTFQELRTCRAKALATELRGLADLYGAHPTRLKMPFAPQARRSNFKHIPVTMRREARVIEKRANTTWWGYKEIFAYRFTYSFPALVMYDWTLQLFRKVMQKHVCLGSEHLEAIVEKTKPVLDGLPKWAPSLLGHLQDDQSAGVSDALNHLDMKPHRWPATNKYHSRTEGELKWLISFAEVVAWMEVEFPEVLQEVKDHGLKDTSMTGEKREGIVVAGDLPRTKRIPRRGKRRT